MFLLSSILHNQPTYTNHPILSLHPSPHNTWTNPPPPKFKGTTTYPNQDHKTKSTPLKAISKPSEIRQFRYLRSIGIHTNFKFNNWSYYSTSRIDSFYSISNSQPSISVVSNKWTPCTSKMMSFDQLYLIKSQI